MSASILTLTPFKIGRALSENIAIRSGRSCMLNILTDHEVRPLLARCEGGLSLGEAAVLLDKPDEIAQAKPPLATLGSVMLEPASVGISADGSRANAQQTAGLFQRELR